MENHMIEEPIHWTEEIEAAYPIPDEYPAPPVIPIHQTQEETLEVPF
jgi:hypothetical protein